MQPLRDISIKKKLYFIVGTMAILIAIELFALWFSIHTLSSVRALVGAEGLWSKAQKDATYQLQKYYNTHNEEDFQNFQRFMKVPMGDHLTRLELLKKNPDMKIAHQGFVEGRVHPEDIDGMIKLLRRFYKVDYINKAISAWTKGDSLIGHLILIGETLHTEITSPAPSLEKLNKAVEAIDPLNHRLTIVEDDFSYILGEGSRWLENLILRLLFLVALTVEITGLVLTISVSRGIARGLNEITKVSKKIARGDLRKRATVFSQDEIGQVATAINQMTEQLISSNNELGQFAYIASHDLQEPLKTITNYVGLFREEYKDKFDENAEKYLEAVTRAAKRMQKLIKDVLDYSDLGQNKNNSLINCSQLLEGVLSDMAVSIKESNTKINCGSLPVINGYSSLNYLFQNLISNAIKFGKKDIITVINITAQDRGNEWLFAVTDNGIGIDQMNYERIFAIFQKLHSQKKYTGTGIGLAHCKKIVELHGGKIWVESEIQMGSTFYFTIPKNIAI